MCLREFSAVSGSRRFGFFAFSPDEAAVGTNPKINNMIDAYSNAAHELIMISDSNNTMEKEALMKMVSF